MGSRGNGWKVVGAVVWSDVSDSGEKNLCHGRSYVPDSSILDRLVARNAAAIVEVDADCKVGLEPE